MSWQVRGDASERRHVFVVLPSYTGHIWLPTAMSLIHNLWQLKTQANIRVEFCPLMFDAQIWMTRSHAAAMFLASEATDMLMIDWDVYFRAPALQKLLSHPVDFVGCDYPRRIEPVTYSTRFRRNGDRSFDMTRDANGLIEVEAVPTGLMRIRRNVIKQMFEAYPELNYTDKILPNQKGCGIFYSFLENNRTWGEDISFCRRWRQIGGRIYLDPSIAVSHWGQKEYIGEYDNWLATMAAADPNDSRFID